MGFGAAIITVAIIFAALGGVTAGVTAVGEQFSEDGVEMPVQFQAEEAENPIDVQQYDQQFINIR